MRPNKAGKQMHDFRLITVRVADNTITTIYCKKSYPDPFTIGGLVHFWTTTLST
jgi:hypothetical protein